MHPIGIKIPDQFLTVGIPACRTSRLNEAVLWIRWGKKTNPMLQLVGNHKDPPPSSLLKGYKGRANFVVYFGNGDVLI